MGKDHSPGVYGHRHTGHAEGRSPFAGCVRMSLTYTLFYFFFLWKGPRVEIAQQPLRQRLIDPVRV